MYCQPYNCFLRTSKSILIVVVVIMCVNTCWLLYRADMHRLVAEISQQLDQQYSARESFHKLKAENEMWALHSAKQKV